MQGKIIRIHSDFYYVDTEKGLFEAKLRDIIRKAKNHPYVGDDVVLESVDENSGQAFISELLPRKTVINKPKAANITQALIVSALKSPDLDFEQLDRFIAYCEYNKIKPVLCFNKDDLDDFSALREQITEIYKLYDIIFTSALLKTGLEDLLPTLKNNTTLLCGCSGVGKSSILNALFDNLNLRTKKVSGKTQKGVHTTRHCELIKIDENTFVVDSPGFSNLTFDFLLPSEVQKLFFEFKSLKEKCKFKDCTHINEIECAFEHLRSSISPTRFESYKKFVGEAKKFKERIKVSTQKIEDKIKYNLNKNITKISSRKRQTSRKQDKQNLWKENYNEE
ncbi:ribosome small subunit-dependent GTPase A [bacterium]|nr:ribosome small subunit-dependent GTPase A [bacterium]